MCAYSFAWEVFLSWPSSHTRFGSSLVDRFGFVTTVAHYLFATMVKVGPMKSFSRFSETERDLAKGWAKQGKTESAIAKLLGRDPGTVNRQLQKPAGFKKKLGRKQVITES